MNKKVKSLIIALTLFALIVSFSAPISAMPIMGADGTYYEPFTFRNTTSSWDTTRRMYMKKTKNWDGVINFTDTNGRVDPLRRPNGSYNTINVVMNGNTTNVSTMRYSERWGCLPNARTTLPWNKGVAAADLVGKQISGWISMQYSDSGTTFVGGIWSPK